MGFHRVVACVGSAAIALALAACGGSAPSVSPSSVPAAPTTVAPATSQGLVRSTTTTAATTTSSTTSTTSTTLVTSSTVEAPAPLTTALPDADGNEGQWEVAAELDGRPVVWTTHWHPYADQPRVYASAAMFDPSRLSAGFYNGTRLPGRGRWQNVGTVQDAVKPWLVATFNGGFELKHITGGYFTEGRTVKRLAQGHATLGVRRSDRRLVLGVLGRDIQNDGSWRSLRQNVQPMIDNGEVMVRKVHAYWGNDRGGVVDVPRSGICNMPDGRMMYVFMGPLDIGPFADAVAATGCVLGMELDINGTWPMFATYDGFGSADRTGITLDPSRMKDPRRVFRAAWHDFFALFDPANLPDGALA